MLQSPAENAVVGPAQLVLTWQRAGPANGSPIIDYPGLVVKPNTGLRGLPKIILDVSMAPREHTRARLARVALCLRPSDAE